MYCKKCGTEQKDGQKFCPNCGAPFVVFESIEDQEKTIQNTDSDHSFSWSCLRCKRKSIAIFAVCALFALCVGWGWKQIADSGVGLFSLTEVDSDIDCIPFKSTAKGKWGMLKLDGTVLFEEEFKDIPTISRESRFMVRNGNGLWEIFTAEESPEKVGDEYVSIGNYYDGIAPAVRKNERISLIDKNGEVLVVLDKSGSKNIVSMENFHYGYALIHTKDAVGIINTKGEELLEAKKYCRLLHVAPSAS